MRKTAVSEQGRTQSEDYFRYWFGAVSAGATVGVLVMGGILFGKNTIISALLLGGAATVSMTVIVLTLLISRPRGGG